MNSNERLRVLYVEDNCDSVEMLTVMFGFSRIDLECAESLSEALTRAAAKRFDLYLLDTKLPDGSGLNLCRTLRAIDPSVPVLFYSANAHSEAISLGIAAGADGYITKPHSDKLVETIIRLVTNRREHSFAPKFLPVLATAA